VVGGNQGLRIYSAADGSLLAEAPSGADAGIASPAWLGDGIYYLRIGDTTELKRVDPGAIGA
jgi:hypothetical protein